MQVRNQHRVGRAQPSTGGACLRRGPIQSLRTGSVSKEVPPSRTRSGRVPDVALPIRGAIYPMAPADHGRALL